MKAVLKPWGGFGHEAGGVDAAVSQTAAAGEMSLELFTVSPLEENICKERKKGKKTETSCFKIFYDNETMQTE